MQLFCDQQRFFILLYFRFFFRHKFDNILLVSNNNFNLRCFSRSYKNLCNAVDLLNSTFTFHLVPIVINTSIIETFAAYSILVEMRSPFKASGSIILLNVTWFIIPIVLQVVIAFFGTSLTKEAQATAVIVSDILNELELKEDVVIKLQNFLVRSQCRNLRVQNEFFVADWKLLVAVSFSEKR